MTQIEFPKISSRLLSIPPFHVMEIVRIAKELESKGMDVIHLEVGEPDFETSDLVIEAAKIALDTGLTRYTDSRGILRLREAISAWYASQNLGVPAERIQITLGASGALLLASAASVNPGERILMADPAYPCNPRFVEAVGGQVHWLETSLESAFHPTRSILEACSTTDDRGLILAHPANPTGLAVPQAELRSMIDWCRQTCRHLIVDEIYQNLSFDPAIQSSLAISDSHFVAASFSKYFNMTGWRLGWLVIPDYALETTQRLAQHLFICAPAFAQEAAISCFDRSVLDQAEQRKKELECRRNYLLDTLPKLGFDIATKPDGAFYIFVDASSITCDAQDFCRRLIHETGVAITPGIDFSRLLPLTWLRIAYTQPKDRLVEAMRRIKIFCGGYHRSSTD